ncbi:sugar ABC transporter ATP-binding protein [Termitidicoccus mucosus]|uniref:Sugar ABC transporter ATP-binding protein n=1 Tax=Termitidicoccus mucosus TaxID=1184151 RepID=A0A178IFK3_9BACT|nr:sugar ABC transporter ATP-binding protein [Opitutaceae bacterium TSB47]
MSAVTLRNLVKQYPGAAEPVVHGIDLEIREGEFMVLVGPSGCGKSTTLRMIAGLEDITGGEITIGGRVVNHVAPKDRDIAMVFQNYALYPHMSVYENMAFGLKLRKFSKAEIDTRVREAAAMLGLDAYLDRKPKALSGGQRQRVAVGRAIVRKPRVFLFDEPLSNLDAKMRVSMRTEISKLHARLGATMIYVTHDQTEAMTMGDRICVMKDGRIMQVAAPLELYNRPADLFTAGFIGSPPMNFLQGQLRREGDTVFFVSALPPVGPDLVSGREHLAASVRPLANRGATQGRALHRGTGVPPVSTRPESHGRVARATQPLQFDLSAPLARRAAVHAGKPAILGIRPEHIHEAANGAPVHLTATVEVSEPMGAETYLYLQTAAGQLIARTGPGSDYESGREVPLSLDLEHARLFDSATGIMLPP